MLISVTIADTTPLLCNRFTDAAGQAASGGHRPACPAGDKGTPREVADNKRYLSADGKGKSVIPQPNMLRCIIDAGKFFKAGKSKVTTQKSSLIPACVNIVGTEIRIEHAEPWNVDERPVRNPTTGGRFLCHRPRFEHWRLSFVIELDESLLSPKLLREIMDAAGKRVGLGDYRPDCKGPFGKFVVVKWVEEKEVAHAAE